MLKLDSCYDRCDRKCSSFQTKRTRWIKTRGVCSAEGLRRVKTETVERGVKTEVNEDLLRVSHLLPQNLH